MKSLSLQKLENTTGRGGAVRLSEQLVIRLTVHLSVEQLIQSVNINIKIRKLVRTKSWGVVQKTGFLLNDGTMVPLFDPFESHKLENNLLNMHMHAELCQQLFHKDSMHSDFLLENMKKGALCQNLLQPFRKKGLEL